jgi:hypothetical protein
MYRNAKLVILNFCAFDVFGNIDEGSKNLHENIPSLISFSIMKKKKNQSLFIGDRLCTSSIIGRNSLAG